MLFKWFSDRNCWADKCRIRQFIRSKQPKINLCFYVTYMLLVHWTKMQPVNPVTELAKVQRLIYLVITKAIKTTLIAAWSVSWNFNSLNLIEMGETRMDYFWLKQKLAGSLIYKVGENFMDVSTDPILFDQKIRSKNSKLKWVATVRSY